MTAVSECHGESEGPKGLAGEDRYTSYLVREGKAKTVPAVRNDVGDMLDIPHSNGISQAGQVDAHSHTTYARSSHGVDELRGPSFLGS